MGLFSFGGGMATIPFLYEIAEKYTWFDKDLVVNMIAIAESTPGPIGVNMATYAGYRAAGIIGAVVATFSLVLPSLILIIILVKILEKFSESQYFKAATHNLKAVVIGLLAAILFEIFLGLLLDEKSFGLANIDFKFILMSIGLFILITKKDVNLVIYFILSGLIGLMIAPI